MSRVIFKELLIADIENKIAREERDKCRKLLLKELQQYKNSAETAECHYKHNLSLLFAELNVSAEEVNANNYSIGDEIAASGAYKDRVILAKYEGSFNENLYFEKTDAIKKKVFELKTRRTYLVNEDDDECCIEGLKELKTSTECNRQ